MSVYNACGSSEHRHKQMNELKKCVVAYIMQKYEKTERRKTNKLSLLIIFVRIFDICRSDFSQTHMHLADHILNAIGR